MNSKCISQSFLPFEGVFAPVCSPFLNDSLNLSVVPQYAKALVDSGVNGIFLCGTNGESVSLTTTERKQILEAWMATEEIKAKKLRMILHIGHHSIIDVLDLANHADSLKVEALALMPPSFFRPANEDQASDYIADIAKKFKHIPFYYYHFPNMTNVRINLQKTLELAYKKSPNIIGAKFSDIDLIDLTLSAHCGFNILVGNDGLFLQALISGASGLIGVQNNFNGELPVQIYTAFLKGEITRVQKLQIKSTIFMNLVRSKGALPAIAKLAVKKLRGIDLGGVRSPVTGIKEEEKEKIGEELKAWLEENLENEKL